MNDLNDMLYNKPLYPNETPFEKSENKDTQKQTASPFSSLFGENMNIQNLLPLILGMKNGNSMDLSSLLSKSMGGNPILQMLSSMNGNKENKKESQSPPKQMAKDEPF